MPSEIKPEMSQDLFVRRSAEKEAARMAAYHDPGYGKAVRYLLYGGAFPAPVRAPLNR